MPSLERQREATPCGAVVQDDGAVRWRVWTPHSSETRLVLFDESGAAKRELPMDAVGFLGNAAGAMKVGIVGHRSSIERAPYVKFLTALLK